MAEHPINSLMDTTLEKIKQMVDVSTVIGDPIVTEGHSIIPVSKVTYGFASGGSDFPSKTQKDLFGGGSAAGVTVTPLAFIVITASGSVKMLPVNAKPDATDKAVAMIPDIVDKISDMIAVKKQPKNDDILSDE